MAENFVEVATELAAIGADLNRNDEMVQRTAGEAENIEEQLQQMLEASNDLDEPITGKGTAASQLSTDLEAIMNAYAALEDDKAGNAQVCKESVDKVAEYMVAANTAREDLSEAVEKAHTAIEEAKEAAITLSQQLTGAQSEVDNALTALND